jgi:tripartite-type tricarboxylate transporter receptor subunit TctC
LPSYVIQAWDAALREMAKDPKTKSDLAKIGVVPFYLDSQETQKFSSKNLENVRKYWP